jgi:hypothetical protein
MEVAYYTCLNNECYKYRGIFMEGDPEHANCERARLYPQQRGVPMWTWFAASALAAIAAGAAVMMFMRRRREQTNLPPMGERRTETWSGIERIADERQSHAVPPPIVPD